jgi:VWFA-related protein
VLRSVLTRRFRKRVPYALGWRASADRRGVSRGWSDPLRRAVGLVGVASLLMLAPSSSLWNTVHAQTATARARGIDQKADGYRFKSGVELINVTATVSDGSGRFVSGLRRDEFRVYEDNQAQEISYFSADRVPVSLGILLDTSGSMAGEKIDEARRALDRFALDLLDERDEVFLYRFSDHPVLVQDWTTDRASLSREMARITPNGGTALYDTLLEAIPVVARGHNQKKALVVITDGNDTTSRSSLHAVREALRDSEVLLYAVGIDGREAESLRQPATPTRPRGPTSMPPAFPFPPIRRPGGRFPFGSQVFGPGGGGHSLPSPSGDDRVNAVALHDMTDDSGGRTEIVRDARDLNPATASIADELSRQYLLGYASTLPKDGRWHAIRVEVPDHSYRVRARTGYTAN